MGYQKVSYFDMALTLARKVAGYSPDPSTKVGAALGHPGRMISVGYNAFPEGVPEEWWADRSKKRRAVVHAEVAALLAAGQLAEGATLFVTHHPCSACAPIIAAAGVVKVVCPEHPWRDDPEVIASVNEAKELFRLFGVETFYCERLQ